jgi:hypothetical protein
VPPPGRGSRGRRRRPWNSSCLIWPGPAKELRRRPGAGAMSARSWWRGGEGGASLICCGREERGNQRSRSAALTPRSLQIFVVDAAAGSPHPLQQCVFFSPARLSILVAPLGLCSVNRPIPISLYFCLLSRMVVGSIQDLHEVGMPRCSACPSGRLESISIKTINSSGP